MLSRDHLLRQMREQVHHPATARELIRVLDVPREQQAAVKRHLKSLAADGSLVIVRGNRYGLADRMDLVVGRLEGHSSGFGFVTPERPPEGLQGDVFVAAPNLKEALHGDRVVVRIERHRSDGRAEGRVVEILERRSQTIVGRYDVDRGGPGIRCAVRQAPAGRRADSARGREYSGPGRHGHRRGHAVADRDARSARTHHRGAGWHRRPRGRYRDHPAQACDSRRARRPRRWTKARRLGAAVKERDLKSRTDFRDRPVVTIDGEDARDFDDAISIERLPNGHYWLGVHIADVAHYVSEGGALDSRSL